MDIWDKVIEQIEVDLLVNGDTTSLHEMLQSVPKDVLIAYLPEEDLLARYPNAVEQVEILKKDFLD